MDQPPIQDGIVAIADSGRIEAVGPATMFSASVIRAAEHFPDAAIIPGLVNTHTHLELTGFEGRVTEDEFPAWVRRVRALKAERTAGDFLAAARRGLQDCFATGVTTVADTGDSGAVIQALAEAGASGIAYQEVFGPHPDQCGESLRWLEAKLGTLEGFAGARVRLGVSPHAPYTVSAPLYRAVTALALDRGLPMAIHVAESREEADLLRTGTGGFADAWRGRGIPLPDQPGLGPVAWLDALGVLDAAPLCIHLVQATAADASTLVRHECAAAHCPRSNRRHGHGDAPLRTLLDAGLRLGVGTDSVASVGALDLLAEARAAQRLADLDAHQALGLCTTGAAAALGLAGDIGRLAPGYWGDVAVVSVDAGHAAGPVEAVLASRPGDVVATYLAGRRVYGRQ